MYRSPPFWILACLALFLAVPGIASSSADSGFGTPMNWLTAINLRRSEAGLPPVVEDPSLSAGARLHSRYLVKTGSQELHEAHAENPRSPWYTAEGDAAARIGNVMSSIYRNATDQFAVDSWTQGPFHLLAYLNPTLSEVGFGSYREEGGRVQMAAALPLSPGRRRPRSAVVPLYPVLWPGHGKTITPPLTQYCPADTACFTSEIPNPLTSCGYSLPAGLPIVMQLGPGTVTPRIKTSRIATGPTALEHCVIDETSYINPDASQQAAMRALLRDLSAVVLVPKHPLRRGRTYAVLVEANGSPLTWTFKTGAAAGR
jgi:Cysteine-rich secretory protein family